MKVPSALSKISYYFTKQRFSDSNTTQRSTLAELLLLRYQGEHLMPAGWLTPELRHRSEQYPQAPVPG